MTASRRTYPSGIPPIRPATRPRRTETGFLSGDGQWILKGSATSREDGHAAVSCGRGKGHVERRERGLVVDSHVQNAAVRQLESGARPQFGQAQRFVGVVRCYIHTGCSKVILHSRTAADPYAADQNLRHRDGVDERRDRK